MKFYTTDKEFPAGSKFNILDGADPIFVYKAFHAGLIENIYPWINLSELNYFPENFTKEIKNFRRMIKAGDKLVYLRFFSSLMNLNKEGCISSYHFFKIGISNTNREVLKPRAFL